MKVESLYHHSNVSPSFTGSQSAVIVSPSIAITAFFHQLAWIVKLLALVEFLTQRTD